jgi:hypothetical protein
MPVPETPRQSSFSIQVGPDTGLENSTAPVELSGSGLIRPNGNSQLLVFHDLTILPGSTIQAKHLLIETHITLIGDAVLSAAEDDHIELRNDSVEVTLRAANQRLPTLNLGYIGNSYTIVVKKVVVEIEMTFFNDNDLANFSHPLVTGETFSSCETWRTRVELSDPLNFELACQGTKSGKANALDEQISLVIKRKPPTDESNDANGDKSKSKKNKSKLSTVATAFVVIGVLVGVVGIAAIIYFVFVRKHMSDDYSAKNEI